MPRFTSATAKAMSAKGHAKRWHSPKPAIALPPNATPLPSPVPDLVLGSAYTSQRLQRVREQLELVDRRITEQASKSTIDGQVLNWLCAAQERLAEQERILAGRPLPGSRRPGKAESSAAPVGAWIEPACGIDTPTGSVQPKPAEAPTPQAEQPTETQQVTQVIRVAQ